ncbi:hypothetical protein BLA29_011434 [Euroglyphus maynei]|uniref:E3 ubiquitin ligase UBR4 C-terminal domain-containing protein n=1 Tax=Euroglyphus maynei TaxID=6958 RepID=A0A1Y3AX92_EURMA|nr:hypothetical protein BLA29_011434 [Euroglyphus maynei]
MELPEYSTIKPALMFFAMINLFYTVMFKSLEIKADDDWSQSLINYIRHNDQSLMESADRMLESFENDILPSTSFTEYCDAADLLRGMNAITDPDEFLKDTLRLS